MRSEQNPHHEIDAASVVHELLAEMNCTVQRVERLLNPEHEEQFGREFTDKISEALQIAANRLYEVRSAAEQAGYISQDLVE